MYRPSTPASTDTLCMGYMSRTQVPTYQFVIHRRGSGTMWCQCFISIELGHGQYKTLFSTRLYSVRIFGNN